MAPTDGTVFLQRSAMAVPVSGQVSEETTGRVLDEVRSMLYYQYASASGGNSRDNAAFRYKVLLYQQDDVNDDGTPDEGAPIRANYEDMALWYGDAERARVLEAERMLRAALIANPLNEDIQNALLDLYYDRAVAELQYAKKKLDELAELRLDVVSGAPTDSTIPAELELWTEQDGLLNVYRSVLDEYGRLLNDSFAFKLEQYDSTYSSGAPLGYYIFQKRVPTTAGRAASYIDADGEIADVPMDPPPASYPILYDGYREMVLLMGVLRDYTEGLAEAAALHAQLAERGNSTDTDRVAAEELIAEGYRAAYVDGQLLLGVFPGLEPESVADSGLQAAIDGWQGGVRRLAEVRRVVKGELNPLGFQPDFLVLTTGFQGGDGDTFDSYNTLANWISEITNPPIRPLAVAQAEFERAQTRYIDYRGYQDQLADNLFDIRRNLDDQVFELVGAVPGEPGYNPSNPPSGAIAEQLIAIELATNRIRRNRVDIDNKYKEIQIEIHRRGVERGINDAIGRVQIEYGNKRADLWTEIGHWRAAQASADAINNMVGNIFAAGPLGLGAAVFTAVVGVANTGVQAGAETAIAEKEAQLERFAAMEDAAITDLQDQILDANSKALVKNLMLDLAALAVDSTQAQLTLRQEVVRLGSLTNRLVQLEKFYNDDAQFASERFYADPLHYLRQKEAEQRAQESFEEARDWIFYTARALEYKWNQPFNRSVGSRTWSIEELFRTRNARELSQMLAAMELYDGAQSFGPGTGTNTDIISLREDILGYRDLDSSDQPILYPDPVSGQLVRAKAAFRSYLNAHTETRDGGDQVVTVRFSTAFSPAGSQFFLGPDFNSQGQPQELGTWLDKIQWIKINIPGSMPSGGFINGFLSDGGSQLIRNATVGSYDPDEPAAIRNEVTSYSSRLWFTQDGGETFEFRENLRAPIRLEVGNPAGTDTLPNVPENTFFKERSVANTEWTLQFTTVDADGAPGGVVLLRIEQVDDIELLINHRFTPRL
jgi:hypothetical protein